ncbi:hypothetical protein MJH12_03695, partial [bacterium]|nr:hypothetical protein [bacterium]
IVLGSGDIFDADSLAKLSSLSGNYIDIVWYGNDLISLREDEEGKTQLEHWSSNFELYNGKIYNGKIYNGKPLKTIVTTNEIIIVMEIEGKPVFKTYVADNDIDKDGVIYTLDAFPEDIAASVDSDGDGWPDEWNDGFSSVDSTSGLTLDFFPSEVACQSESHLRNGVCDIRRKIPKYQADQILFENDVIYLLSTIHSKIFRWSYSEQYHLDPINIPQNISKVTYSAKEHKLYMSDSLNTIYFVDLNESSNVELFATLPKKSDGLLVCGSFLFVAFSDTYLNIHRVYDFSGNLVQEVNYKLFSKNHIWNDLDNKMYYLQSNQLYSIGIDQNSGQFGSQTNRVYVPESHLRASINLSKDRNKLVLASGEIFDIETMKLLAKFPHPVEDVNWFSTGFISLENINEKDTKLIQWNEDLIQHNVKTVNGTAIKIVSNGDSHHVLVTIEDGHMTFVVYEVNDDGDQDGITNELDDFPLDVAASKDFDGDGWPDSWNEGYSSVDSTLGLTIDNYPQDYACQLLSHGENGVCDHSNGIPPYIPTETIFDGNIIYLLSQENDKVFRWSLSKSKYLSAVLLSDHPSKITYYNNELLVAYADGQINKISVQSNMVETHFTKLASSPHRLITINDFVLTANLSNSYRVNSIYDSNGVLKDWKRGGGQNFHYTWSPEKNILYFLEGDESYEHIYFDRIDPITGHFMDSEPTRYFKTEEVRGPINISLDESQILLGTGK